MKEFNVKVVFWENGQQAAELVFKAEQKDAGTDVGLTLETSGYNTATLLAKHLEQYLQIRLLEIKKKDMPNARA